MHTKEYNILILSAGRRVELINCFQKAASKLNINSKVVAVDISNTAPAIYFADIFRFVPKINSEGYIDSIIDICNNENISLIVPTIDTELLILSEFEDKIENSTNAKVLISNSYVVNICINKNNMQKFFEENNFLVPKLISESDVENNNYEFPLFIKPKYGSSSVNTFKINNEKELMFFKDYVKEPIIQKFMEGTEYSVDVFCDFQSNPITIVPRIRLAMRSGEISKGKIVKDTEIIKDIKRLIDALKPVGHITVQCMKTKRGVEYIEINPRFGGGAPMSITAGADSCENLYRLLIGETLKYNENYKDEMIFLRFDNSICLNENMELIND